VQQAIREAIGRLQRLVSQRDDAWRVWFLLGKAWHAVDRIPRAIQALERALEVVDEPQTIIYKELAGVLLAGGDTERACQTGEKAVALAPDDVELLGNLSIAYLLDGRLETARKTLEHALTICCDDTTNQFVMEKITAVLEGRLPRPRTLAELEGRGPSTGPESTPRPKSSWIRGLLRRFSPSR
jgi:Flp pilus assembly protein TadD